MFKKIWQKFDGNQYYPVDYTCTKRMPIHCDFKSYEIENEIIASNVTKLKIELAEANHESSLELLAMLKKLKENTWDKELSDKAIKIAEKMEFCFRIKKNDEKLLSLQDRLNYK